MVRASKQSTTSVAKVSSDESSEIENTLVVNASVLPLKKEKKVSTKSKAKLEVAAEVAVVPDLLAVDTLPVVVTPAPVEVESIETKLSDFSNKLQLLTAALSSVRGQYKVIEKIVARELKAAKKSSSRKSKRAGNRQPSGFIRPTLISDELAIFLNKPEGTEMARTSVSKEINQYIRTNSLQDKTNGRKIIPDASLAKLLRLSVDDDLTYFNLQRYMKPHFVKVTPPLVVSEASVTVA
mgnify:CR=1 FL=1